MEEKEEREVVCKDCEYKWKYTGNLDRATCPNCGAKNKVED